MSKDDWIYTAIGTALVIGGTWVYEHYEIRKKSGPAPSLPPAVVATYVPARPTGLLPVGITQTDSIWQLDADSITGPRNARQGWLIMDASKDKTRDYRTSKELVLVDCVTTSERVLSTTYIDAKGATISSSSTEPKDAKVDYFAPGTMGASVVRNICFEGFDAPK